MFRLRWTEPGGAQTAYVAPAKSALDMYVRLLCQGYAVEVCDSTGTELTPDDLVLLASEGQPAA